MKTLYIHAGYGKTGTTFIQNFFFHNHKYIENFYYPKIYDNNSQHHIHLSSLNKISFVKQAWIDLYLELEDVKEENILISTEELIYDEHLHNNFDFIKKLFSDYEIKIIIVIRNFINIIFKTYLEFIKNYDNKYTTNNIFTFIDKFHDNFKHKETNKFLLNFKNVIIMNYSKEKLLENFCRKLEIKLNLNNFNILKKIISLNIEYSSYLEQKFSEKINKKKYLKICDDFLNQKNLENYNLNFSKFSENELKKYRIVLINNINLYVNKNYYEIIENYNKIIKKTGNIVNNSNNNIYHYLFNKYELNLRNPTDPINYEIIKKYNINKKLLTHIHCYNIDNLQDIFGEYIENIIKYFSVVVTYSIGSQIPKYNLTILKIENRGVDIGAKICFLKYIKDLNIIYTHILFLHSKTNFLIRKEYFNPLIENENIIKKNISLLNYYDVILNNIHDYYDLNDEYISNRYYHKEILNYLEVSNSNEMYYSEGNCYIFSKKIIDFLFYDNLHIFYNILNSKESFDISWVKGRYGKKDISNEKLYEHFKNNDKYMDLNKNGKAVGNNFGNISNDMPDGMIEHIFERIYINIIEHLNLKYIIV